MTHEQTVVCKIMVRREESDPRIRIFVCNAKQAVKDRRRSAASLRLNYLLIARDVAKQLIIKLCVRACQAKERIVSRDLSCSPCASSIEQCLVADDIAELLWTIITG